MYTGFTEMGMDITKAEVQLLISKWDEDLSGNINFDEFLKGIRGVLSPARQRVVDDAFAKFDKAGGGTIDIEDLIAHGYHC